MKKLLWLSCLLILAGGMAGEANAQTQTRYVKKQMRQYWLDGQDRPWNDFGYQMAVRIDPRFAQGLGEEISSDDAPPLKYEIGKWKFYSLKEDDKGTYADVEYLVNANSEDPITYQIELQKGGVAAPFRRSEDGLIRVSNNSPNRGPIALQMVNTVTLMDWLKLLGLWLLGALLVYVLVFRWLFNVLLKRRWTVSSAENFTWSMSLLLLLMLALGLGWLRFGWRAETYYLISLLGLFWFLHLLIWAFSKPREA